MAQCLAIHPDDPQPRLITQAVSMIQKGGVIVYPTECCYALGCQLNNKAAVERMLRIRHIDTKHPLTLMCQNLSQLSQYAHLENEQFRLLKTLDHGVYTFILEATKAVPARLLHPKQKTIGVRISAQPITQALIAKLGEPLLSCTLWLSSDDEPLTDSYDICRRLDHDVDLVIDGGWCGTEPTTVIDLVNDIKLIRAGRGETTSFGF